MEKAAANSEKPLIYITRDIERALGKQPDANYRIITNRTPYAESIQKLYPAWTTLIESAEMLDTSDLMEHEVTLETLSRVKADVLVFKNNSRIESIAKTHGWNLLNPRAALAEKVENKITQVEWLGKLGDEWLPPHKIQTAKEIIWNKEPVIIQWAHGHTGDSTILINTPQELKAVQEKFPERLARVSTYIYGPSFTVNVVVAPDKILVGNISYQITGMPPFTESAFATVGNDWSVPLDFLTEEEISSITLLAATLGEKLRADGWKGLFGIDIIRDQERNRIFFLEINARQPASTTFESILQNENRTAGIPGETIFEAHLATLYNQPITAPLIPINDGSQVIQRLTSKVHSFSAKTEKALSDLGLTLIPYNNTDENSDLLRIQSRLGIMEIHGRFNTRGKEIVDTLLR